MVPLALVGMSYREAPSAVRAALAAIDAEADGPSQRLLASGEITGVVELTPAQIDDLEKGCVYVQLHSEKAPDGNLWGWLFGK